MTVDRAERRRRERNMPEYVAQAHDRLHKDDVDACHQLLHTALGVTDDTDPGDVAPLSHRSGFDEAFRELCLRHGVEAMYVLVDGVDNEGYARLLAGGAANLCREIEAKLRD